MATAFVAQGAEVACVWSRNAAHAARFAAQFASRCVPSLASLDPSCDLYIIAVSDDAIAHVASQLPAVGGLVVHTSGATPLGAIVATGRKGAVVWSPQTFVAGVPVVYSDLFFCIEACSEPVAAEAERLFGLLSAHLVRISGEVRARCHLAAVMVSNFGNALNAMAEQLLQADGLDIRLLLPIIEQTAGKASRGNLWSLQTGPAARGDSGTVAAHRQILAACNPQWAELYDLFTDIIHHATH